MSRFRRKSPNFTDSETGKTDKAPIAPPGSGAGRLPSSLHPVLGPKKGLCHIWIPPVEGWDPRTVFNLPAGFLHYHWRPQQWSPFSRRFGATVWPSAAGWRRPDGYHVVKWIMREVGAGRLRLDRADPVDALNEPDITWPWKGKHERWILWAHDRRTISLWVEAFITICNLFPNAPIYGPHWSQVVTERPWVLREFWRQFDLMGGDRRRVQAMCLHAYQGANDVYPGYGGDGPLGLLYHFIDIQPRWLLNRPVHISECAGDLEWYTLLIEHPKVERLCFYTPDDPNSPWQQVRPDGSLRADAAAFARVAVVGR